MTFQTSTPPTNKKLHILQHVPFEDIGAIADWAAQRQATCQYTRFYQGDRLPATPEADLIVVMGGPMSIHDEAEFPWLRDEKRWLADALARQVPVLGICLGAQLIAAAAGARVYRNPEREIGWFPITRAGNVPAALAWPEQLTVLHWHGETFDLPTGAEHWARSAACAHQVFALGRRALGLQCHLEMAADNLTAIINECRHELTAATWVQGEADLQAGLAEYAAACHALLGRCLDYLTTA